MQLFDPQYIIEKKYKRALVKAAATSQFQKGQIMALSGTLASKLEALRKARIEDLHGTYGYEYLKKRKQERLGIPDGQDITVSQVEFDLFVESTFPSIASLERYKEYLAHCYDLYYPIFNVMACIIQRRAFDLPDDYVDRKSLGLTPKMAYRILKNQNEAVAEMLIRTMASGGLLEQLLESFEDNNKKEFRKLAASEACDYTALNRYSACSLVFMSNYSQILIPDIKAIQENEATREQYIESNQEIADLYLPNDFCELLDLFKKLYSKDTTPEGIFEINRKVKELLDEFTTPDEDKQVEDIYTILTKDATPAEQEVLISILKRPENLEFYSKYTEYATKKQDEASTISVQTSDEKPEEQPQISSRYMTWEEYKSLEQCKNESLYLRRSFAKFPWKEETDSIKPYSRITEYETVVMLYEAFVDKGILDDSQEEFEKFVFKMTGNHSAQREPDSFGHTYLKLDSQKAYCLIKNLWRPENPSRHTAEKTIYEKAFNLFDWRGKPDDFIKRTATAAAEKAKGWFENHFVELLGTYYK